MQAAILQAARALFVREGYQHVSIRRIARRIGYSPATIYLYFPGKRDILEALARDGFDRLRSALADPGSEDDVQAALERRLWLYYEFSRNEPDYFWLLFVDRAILDARGAQERFPALREMEEVGTTLVGNCVAAGLFPPGTVARAAFQVLSIAVHGAAVARLCGRPGRRRDADTAARDTLRAAIAGLRAGVALDSGAFAFAGRRVRRPAVPRTPESLP